MRRYVGIFRFTPLLLVLSLLMVGCAPPAARNVAIWIVDENNALTTDTAPNAENAIYSAARGTAQLTAALNETVAFQLALRTTAPPAGPFDVVVSDLAGPGTTLRSTDCVQRYRVHYQRVENFHAWYPQHTGQPATPTLFPDLLVPWEAPTGGGASPAPRKTQRNRLDRPPRAAHGHPRPISRPRRGPHRRQQRADVRLSARFAGIAGRAARPAQPADHLPRRSPRPARTATALAAPLRPTDPPVAHHQQSPGRPEPGQRINVPVARPSHVAGVVGFVPQVPPHRPTRRRDRLGVLRPTRRPLARRLRL